MKLKVLTEEGLELLEHNIAANINHYQKQSNEWIYEFLGDEGYIKEFHTEVPDFELKVNKGDSSNADIENVKTIYSNLKFLTNEQASDPGFWTGIIHLNFWGFMYNRWEVKEKEQSLKNIEGRYFISAANSHRRSLIINIISKYWWVGRKLYNEDADDPFNLLQFFKSDYTTKSHTLFSSSYANNDEIIRFIIEGLIELEEEIGRILTRIEFRKVLVYLNILGGINVLDYFSKEELKNRIKDNFYKEIKLVPST